MAQLHCRCYTVNALTLKPFAVTDHNNGQRSAFQVAEAQPHKDCTMTPNFGNSFRVLKFVSSRVEDDFSLSSVQPVSFLMLPSMQQRGLHQHAAANKTE